MSPHIIVPPVPPRVQYAADGVQTVFTYPFPVFEAADLEVYLDGALQTAGYDVAGAGQSAGGSVTFAAAPPAGVRVTLRRQLAIRRTTDFQEGGEFRAKTLNDELDYQTAAIQQLDRQQARALALGPADADVETVLPDRAARAGRLLGFDGAGRPVALDPAAAPASGGTTTVIADGAATPRSLAHRFADRVNILDHGAVRDGTSDDLPAFDAARTAAGSTGTVWLPGPGSYRFAGTRPDLSGCTIAADPGVVIVVDENPNTRELDLATPLTIANPVHGTTRSKPANRDVPMALHNLGAAAATAMTPQSLTAIDLTDGWTAASITGTATKGEATATVEEHRVSWEEPFESGQEGVFQDRPPLVGELYEATFHNAGASVDGGFVSAILITDLKRYDFALFSGLAQFQVIETPGGTTVTLPTPNGGAYSLAPNGASVTLGLRFPDAGTVEVYVNDHLLHTHTVANFLSDIGFAISWHLSGEVTIENPIRYDRVTPQSPRPLRVAAIGDSITYGAWASLPWPELLKGVAQNLPGIGRLTVTNYGISSTNAVDWAEAIDGYDFSSQDYVMVLLGTNDVQGLTDPEEFEAALGTIADAVVGDGAAPIFGIFPVFTRSDLSGVGGVGTANYEKGALYRSIVKRFCAENGYEMANALDAFGTNLAWYNDNIHPTVEGLVPIAKAFAAALWRAVAPKPVGGHGAWIRPTMLNNWTGFSPTHQEPQYRKRPDGMVELRGSVKSGTVGYETPIFTLPPGFRPNVIRCFGITTGDPDAEAGELFIFPGSSNGNVSLGKGSNTKVNLNGIIFEAEQ